VEIHLNRSFVQLFIFIIAAYDSFTLFTNISIIQGYKIVNVM